MSVKVEISYGELLDKISILDIKRDHATADEQRANIEAELALLTAARDRTPPRGEDVGDLFERLKSVNARLWAVEDDLRDCERRQDFGAAFVDLARSVYRLNDERGRIKKDINTRLGSAIVEEKLYARY